MAKTIFPNYMPEGEAKTSFAPKSNPEFTGSISMGRSSVSDVGRNSVAVGSGGLIASGFSSHAEGSSTTAMGDYSHAEGDNTKAWKYASHAEGYHTSSSGSYSHAEGYFTSAKGDASHAEGRSTTADGENSHAGGLGTTAKGENSFVYGKYNVLDNLNPSAQAPVPNQVYNVGDLVKNASIVYECLVQHAYTSPTEFNGGSTLWKVFTGKYAEIVGNGTANNARSNARTLDWKGNETLAGSLTLGSTTLTEAKLQQLLALLS